MTLAIGSKIVHEGNNDYAVTKLEERRGVTLATFENERFRVLCKASELVYFAPMDVFYLPGRIELGDLVAGKD